MGYPLEHIFFNTICPKTSCWNAFLNFLEYLKSTSTSSIRRIKYLKQTVNFSLLQLYAVKMQSKVAISLRYRSIFGCLTSSIYLSLAKEKRLPQFEKRQLFADFLPLHVWKKYIIIIIMYYSRETRKDSFFSFQFGRSRFFLRLSVPSWNCQLRYLRYTPSPRNDWEDFFMVTSLRKTVKDVDLIFRAYSQTGLFLVTINSKYRMIIKLLKKLCQGRSISKYAIWKSIFLNFHSQEQCAAANWSIKMTY